MSPSIGPRPSHRSIRAAVFDAFKQNDRRKLLDEAKAELQAERAKPKPKRSQRSR